MIMQAVSGAPATTAATAATSGTGSTTGATSTSGGTTASGGSGSVTSATGSVMGKDDFLKLLVAQMQNQDPMNPTNPDQMAAQLAQFSSLEQLIDIHDALSTQASSSSSMSQALNNSAAVGVIGKNVLATGNAVTVDGSGTESVTVGVGGTGGNATLTIYDASGNAVGTRDLGAIGGGRQDIQLGDAAKGLDPGQYTYGVTVTDADGNPVKVTTLERATIDGVRYGSQGATLLAGSLEIPLANVVEIISQPD